MTVGELVRALLQAAGDHGGRMPVFVVTEDDFWAGKVRPVLRVRQLSDLSVSLDVGAPIEQSKEQ